ncbi:unnamed protein product [Orchesella dallaii]|uniref:Uncharacterized protein n=1 Tax=Orchesella dallaii TaxID=48710 RepID=A0ABP1RJ73_9HEXA
MGDANSTRTYFKVYATFKCSSDACNRTWNSAHAWKRDEAITCEWCHENADLLHVVDEPLTLDNYRCTTNACDGYWQSIHDGMNSPQECDICGVLVDPDADGVQERFGRHYYFTCGNDACPVKPEWEDFSLEPQKTQRCTACFSRGDIIKIQELKRPSRWVRRRRQERLAKEGKVDNISLGGGGGGGGDEVGKHNSDFCDMCGDVQRQGLGSSCYKAKKIVTAVEQTEDGVEIERIIRAE